MILALQEEIGMRVELRDIDEMQSMDLLVMIMGKPWIGKEDISSKGQAPWTEEVGKWMKSL